MCLVLSLKTETLNTYTVSFREHNIHIQITYQHLLKKL